MTIYSNFPEGIIAVIIYCWRTR